MANAVRISEACSLALHTMAFIASQNGSACSTRDIADELGVSADHLAKVLQRLAKARLVSNTRGPKGGSRLAKNPQDITLLQIYETIEGSFTFGQCVLGKSHCSGLDCMLGGFMERANIEIHRELSRTTLQHLIHRAEQSIATTKKQLT